MKVFVISAAAVALPSVGIAACLALGRQRWEQWTEAVRQRLDTARSAPRQRAVDFAALHGLPAPVQRYFRAVLTDGSPTIAAVSISQTGTFNMDENGAHWRRFTARQRVVVCPPGFLWDARISLLPVVRAHVHDAYIHGEGVLTAAVAGLIKVADVHGSGEWAEGELLRFLAEAPWYPTALFPGGGVKWEPLSDSAARATLADGQVRASLVFDFDASGYVSRVHAEARGRNVGGSAVPTPWQGRFWNYAERGGMMVPLQGEVAWVLPHGVRPYWRGTLADIRYEFGG